MADDKRTTPGSGDAARRHRPAPTIDLTATEVGAPTDAAQETPHASSQHRGRIPGEGTTDQLSTRLLKSPLVAGFAGGGLVAAMLFAIWLAGLVPVRAVSDARVANLEMQVRELAGKPVAAGDSKAIDEVKERVGKIEQSVAKLPAGDPGTAERLAAVENAMKAIGIALAALNRRADDISTSMAAAGKAGADADILQKRVDALENAAKATQEKAAQGGSADHAVRLAVTSIALRDSLARGEPFLAQLGVVRMLGADPNLLAPLDVFAPAGVPSDGALARELTALLPAMFDASGARATDTGFLDRLQANAGKLVRIRPASEPAGDEASAVLARLELKAAHGDIAGASADIAKLPAKSRALAEAWGKKADARRAALAAGDALVADTMRMLGKATGSP